MTTNILKPYTRRRDPGRLQRTVTGIALVSLAALYGVLLSVLPMQFLLLPLVPILLGVALILWLLPDIGGVQEPWMRASMQWFVLLNVLWPTYVAINAPGLPWISGTRVALFALMVAALVNFATSSDFRGRIADAMAAIPLVQRAFWVFWGATAFSLLISVEPFVSLSKFANNQIYWTAMLALSAWLATTPGFASAIGRTLGWTIMIVGALAVNEYRAGGVVWLPYLPSWLTADEGFMKPWIASFDKRRKMLIDGLNAIKGVSCNPAPLGAFYVFPDVSATYGTKINGKEITDSLTFASIFLEEARVALVPGKAFGEDRCIRMSYATSEKVIAEGLKRMADYLK